MALELQRRVPSVAPYGRLPVGKGQEATGLRVFFAGVASAVFFAALAPAFVTDFLAAVASGVAFLAVLVAVGVSVTVVSFLDDLAEDPPLLASVDLAADLAAVFFDAALLADSPVLDCVADFAAAAVLEVSFLAAALVAVFEVFAPLAAVLVAASGADLAADFVAVLLAVSFAAVLVADFDADFDADSADDLVADLDGNFAAEVAGDFVADVAAFFAADLAPVLAADLAVDFVAVFVVVLAGDLATGSAAVSGALFLAAFESLFAAFLAGTAPAALAGAAAVVVFAFLAVVLFSEEPDFAAEVFAVAGVDSSATDFFVFASFEDGPLVLLVFFATLAATLAFAMVVLLGE